jgi:tetratricopeptide (TPR) repeat protein
MAAVHEAQEDHKEAISVYKKCLKIRQVLHQGESHVSVGECHFAIARSYLARRKYQRALMSLENALESYAGLKAAAADTTEIKDNILKLKTWCVTKMEKKKLKVSLRTDGGDVA